MSHEIIASGIFLVTLLALFTEKWHRVVVTGIGASVMVATGTVMGFYNETIAVDAVEFETLGLLMGMMILVALLRKTGFFEYVSIQVAQRSGGHYSILLLMMGITTSILSMFLDNVTTIMLMSPMIILIAELLDISPIPLLITQAIFSNLGGMATLVGDPPNILIGAAAGLTFNDFLFRIGPIVFVVWIFSYFVLRFLFREELVNVPPENQQSLHKLKPGEALADPISARQILIILVGVVIFFFLESTLHVKPAFAAMTGAGLALGWTQQNVHEVLQEVEWDVLLFFTALFIMVGGLEQAGVLHQIADSISALQELSPTLLGLMIMWAMVVLSAVIDNVPITIAVIPVVLFMAEKGINVTAIWWAIALGAGLGGNATPIGSTANVIVMSVSERTETPITTREWLAKGIPTAFVGTIVASILYILLFDYLSHL